MSNEIMIPQASQLPAYLQQVLANNQALLQTNLNAAEGIGAGAPPTITAVQGMFKKKIDGVEEVIQIEVQGMGKMNAPKIAAVILAGKPTLDRAYFATAYTGGTEPVSPDCSSEDGIRPKADSPNKQCESCAGCPQNMWASAKNQDGTPAKGKACAEKKRLAIFADNNIFRFNVPPASLGDFAAYARQLAGHGLPLSMVITTISFDPATPTKLVFAFQGLVPEAAANKVLAMVDSDEVKAIMQNFTAPAALPAPAQNQTVAAQPDPAVEAAAKAEADKKAKAAEATAKKKADAEAKKKAEEEAKAAAAAAASADAGLGLDLGMGDSAPAETATGGEGEISDDELANLFSM